jgi:anti-sigma regulatory factor (Ser/Thr protein kinase)
MEGHAGVVVRIQLRGGDRRLTEMRRALVEAAVTLSADDDWLAMVATELATNALAVSPDGAAVEVSVSILDDGSVEVMVADLGPGPPSLPASAPPVHGARGRGLFLVQELSDAFSFERQGDRTVARCRRAS